MRYLGLDLGTKTLGVAVSDVSNTFALPLKTLHFPVNEYDKVLGELEDIVQEKHITAFVLGLPKNMDNSLGFASKRSLNFKSMLENNGIVVHLEDERLTTVSALNILKDNGIHKINEKKKTDIVSAVIILESFLRKIWKIIN